METNVQSLVHRLKLADFRLNNNPKYREYTRGTDYYNKVHNKSDEMMRIAYFLVNFLTSAPPKLTAATTNGVDGEELVDYDNVDEENNARAKKTWDYHSDDYTLYTLEDLPVVQEAELDVNLVMFHGFISLIKPASFFIHKHEMVPGTRKETRKESATRVLMNLAQLLIFSRSVKEEKATDSFDIIYALFYRFTHFFTINKVEPNGDGDVEMEDKLPDYGRGIFQMFPDQAAQLLLILMAYGEQDLSLDQWEEEVDYLFTMPLTAFSDQFKAALNNNRQVINECLKDSKSVGECCDKLKKYANIADLRQHILSIARVLATKVIKEVNDHASWDPKVSYMDMNYENIVEDLKESHVRELDALRSEIEIEVRKEQEKDKLELEQKILNMEHEIQLLLQKDQASERVIETLQSEKQLMASQINDTEKNGGLPPSFTYSDLEKMYPSLVSKLKTSLFTMASKKISPHMKELEQELAKLRSEAHSTTPRDNSHVDNGAPPSRDPEYEEDLFDQSVTHYNHYNNGYQDRQAPTPYYQERGGASTYRPRGGATGNGFRAPGPGPQRRGGGYSGAPYY